MLVGAPNAGKTCVLKVLAETLCLLKERQLSDEEGVIYRTVNPKAITMGQLFGEFDPVTHEVFHSFINHEYEAIPYFKIL